MEQSNGSGSEAEMVQEIAALHQQVKSGSARTLAAVRAGKLLNELKGTMAHSSWMPWLAKHRKELGFGDRTAERYMALAKATANSPELANLPLSKAYDAAGIERQKSKPKPSDGRTQIAVLAFFEQIKQGQHDQSTADLVLVPDNLRKCNKETLEAVEVIYASRFGITHAKVAEYIGVRNEQSPKTHVTAAMTIMATATAPTAPVATAPTAPPDQAQPEPVVAEATTPTADLPPPAADPNTGLPPPPLPDFCLPDHEICGGVNEN